MATKQLSHESNAVIEIIPKNPSKFQRYIGIRDITLKDILTMLFTLLIPTMIAISAVLLQKNEIDLTQKNRDNDLHISKLQRQSDQEQTEALGNDTVFNSYVKNIVDITLYYKTDGSDSPQYKSIRVLTLTALRQLNFEKKKLLVQFLYDMEFARRGTFIFYVKIEDDDVKHLDGAILDNVDLSYAFKLSGLLLRRVQLINASFSNSYLKDSDFTNSILTGVNFSQTNLIGAKFFNTQLQQTDFRGASLENAQFIRSNLTQSNITDKQLGELFSIYNTILPNGTYARNKTFVINGDANDGLNGWNVTSGDIRVVDHSFNGNNNSRMMQKINTTNAILLSFDQTFQYCLSFLVYGQDNLVIEITFFDKNEKFNGEEKINSSKFDHRYDVFH